MNKFLLLIIINFLIFSNLSAKTINKIAYIINDDIITTYDIKKKQQQLKKSKKEVVDELIREVLLLQQLKKFKIEVSDDDLNQEILLIARRNNMKYNDFMNVISTNAQYSSFLDDLKKQLSYKKLAILLSRGSIAIASDDDLKIYYNNNKKEFLNIVSISGILYTSQNENALRAQIYNPISKQQGVFSQKIFKTMDSINNPQLLYLLRKTKTKSFTPIYQTSSGLNSIFISNKKYSGYIPFKRVKSSIFKTLMQKRQEDFLKDYFDNLKNTADIKKL